MSMVNEWKHLEIPFDEIKVATKNFKTLIGRGGYGWVFKGKLLVSGKKTKVAVKRLNEQCGQGLKEFLTEIQSLSGQQHPNLISLVGFCDDGREKSIVYEYAERGSLDRYIRCTRKTSSTTLTWLQRLKICVDAAHGLDYLHRHIGGHRSIIHRDIKSSNILIDKNWVAKISDLGLSKLTVTGFGMSDVVTNACGTQGYCEPEYSTTLIVTKKSDVYSFGVVLFEVFCGRLCLVDSDDGFSLSGISAKEYYKNNTLDEIVDQSLREHMGSYSMNKFAEIAYRCLDDDRKQRPAMDIVVKELEEALKYQFLWINNEGKKCLLISPGRFIKDKNNQYLTWDSHNHSSSGKLAIYSSDLKNIDGQIKTRMLSLGTMYEASLIFKYQHEFSSLFTTKWKMGKLNVHSIHVAEKRKDNWYTIKLWYFFNNVPDAEFDMVIDTLAPDTRCGKDKGPFLIKGIEFQPVKMIEGFKTLSDEDDVDDDEYWEKKLPENYQRYIEMSDKPLDYTTKKKLYHIFCHGFLADKGQLWFSICKSTHGISSLLSASNILSRHYRAISLSESRFKVVKELGDDYQFCVIKATLESVMFSPQYTYACYLLFKFSFKPSVHDHTLLFRTECMLDSIYMGRMRAYLSTYPMNIPTIKPKNDYGLHDSSNILKTQGLAMKKDRTEDLGYSRIEERNDGWMEVMLFKPTNQLLDHSHLQIDLWESNYWKYLNGMIIEGIEFRPYI